jgi:hypothetical protein
MKIHDRAIRDLKFAWRTFVASQKGGGGSALIPFIVNLPEDIVPKWLGLQKVETVIREAAIDAVARLASVEISPGRILAHKNAPAELRSQAARSILAMRGGKATAAKMRESGYPNLVKAREALKHKNDALREQPSRRGIPLLKKTS